MFSEKIYSFLNEYVSSFNYVHMFFIFNLFFILVSTIQYIGFCFLLEADQLFSKKQEKKRKLLHSLCRYTSIKGFGIIFLEGRLSVMMLSVASSNSHLKIAI